MAPADVSVITALPYTKEFTAGKKKKKEFTAECSRLLVQFYNEIPEEFYIFLYPISFILTINFSNT